MTKTKAKKARKMHGKQVGRPTNAKVEARQYSDMLKPDGILQIGLAIAGGHWQADVAKKTGYSKSAISRFMNAGKKGGRTPDDIFGEAIRKAIIENLRELREALTVSGVPHADTAGTRKGLAKLDQAIDTLTKGH